MELKGTSNSICKLKFNPNEKPNEILTDQDIYNITICAYHHIPNVLPNYIIWNYIIFHNIDHFDRKFKIKNVIFSQIKSLEKSEIKIFDKYIIATVNGIIPGKHCDMKQYNNWFEVYMEIDNDN